MFITTGTLIGIGIILVSLLGGALFTLWLGKLSKPIRTEDPEPEIYTPPEPYTFPKWDVHDGSIGNPSGTIAEALMEAGKWWNNSIESYYEIQEAEPDEDPDSYIRNKILWIDRRGVRPTPDLWTLHVELRLTVPIGIREISLQIRYLAEESDCRDAYREVQDAISQVNTYPHLTLEIAGVQMEHDATMIPLS